MDRQYSTRDFFRQLPPMLLERYFQQYELLNDFDFAAMKEGRADALFEAWLTLPDSKRDPIDAELREIFTLCCEKGFLAILDEIRRVMRHEPDASSQLIGKLSSLRNHFERAMIVFLEHTTFWQGALRFYHADTLSYWRKRKNLPRRAAVSDEASCQQLSQKISAYFHHTEGRGKNCAVEAYRRGELDYFFCYPEDHSKRSIEWVNGKFNPRPHNPAFEIVYVYSQKDASLDLNFRGAYKAIEPLQFMFAEAILKLDKLPPNPKDERVYDLKPLRWKQFNFNFQIGSGIESVAVKKIRFSSRENLGDRITVEANTTEDPKAIYPLIEQIGQSVPLHLYNVTQVEIATTVVMNSNKSSKSCPIRITYPNSCSLKYDAVDLKLRDMLEASGIEPKEPNAPIPMDIAAKSLEAVDG